VFQAEADQSFNNVSVARKSSFEDDDARQQRGENDDDDADEMMPDFEAAESLNSGKDMATEAIDSKLKDVSPR
jgi:hypothetical protein